MPNSEWPEERPEPRTGVDPHHVVVAVSEDLPVGGADNHLGDAPAAEQVPRFRQAGEDGGAGYARDDAARMVANKLRDRSHYRGTTLSAVEAQAELDRCYRRLWRSRSANPAAR
jgi:hypothetical protein